MSNITRRSHSNSLSSKSHIQSIIFTISKKNPEIAVQSFPKLRSIHSGPTHYHVTPWTLLLFLLFFVSTVAFLKYCHVLPWKEIEDDRMKLSIPIISRVQLRRNIKNGPQFLRTVKEQYLILYDTDPTRGSVFVDVTYSKKDTTFSNIDVRAWPTTLIWHLWSYWLPLTTSFKITSYIMRTRKRVDQYQNPILSHFCVWDSEQSPGCLWKLQKSTSFFLKFFHPRAACSWSEN